MNVQTADNAKQKSGQNSPSSGAHDFTYPEAGRPIAGGAGSSTGSALKQEKVQIPEGTESAASGNAEPAQNVEPAQSAQPVQSPPPLPQQTQQVPTQPLNSPAPTTSPGGPVAPLGISSELASTERKKGNPLIKIFLLVLALLALAAAAGGGYFAYQYWQEQEEEIEAEEENGVNPDLLAKIRKLEIEWGGETDQAAPHEGLPSSISLHY